MTFGLVFWILMLIWLVFGLWDYWAPNPIGLRVHTILIFILFLLLGWRTFGAPIHP